MISNNLHSSDAETQLVRQIATGDQTSNHPDYNKTIMGAFQKVNDANDFVSGVAK